MKLYLLRNLTTNSIFKALNDEPCRVGASIPPLLDRYFGSVVVHRSHIYVSHTDAPDCPVPQHFEHHIIKNN